MKRPLVFTANGGQISFFDGAAGGRWFERQMIDNAQQLLRQDWVDDCYRAAIAWAGAVAEPDWIVLHGTVVSERTNERIEHAWCERGDLVVDLTRPIGAKMIERDRYYRSAKPDVHRMYSSGDALLLSIKNGHPGPWYESEQLTK